MLRISNVKKIEDKMLLMVVAKLAAVTRPEPRFG